MTITADTAPGWGLASLGRIAVPFTLTALAPISHGGKPHRATTRSCACRSSSTPTAASWPPR